MEILKLDSVDSTNTWISQNEKELPEVALVYAEAQIAGRGQRGNSWESEPGKNITASLIFHPEEFRAVNQFTISEAIAMAIVSFLKDYGVEATIKWPNDIYAGDKKICGILVEHVVTGKNIQRTIAGMGININQTEFLSDAPNPVSLTMLTGKTYNVEALVRNLALHLEKAIKNLDESEKIHSEFKGLLWRKGKDLHPYNDKIRGEKIMAAIEDVERSGMLILITSTGEIRKYAFKEVEFVL